ncbi:unnamed protein product, partial [Meganyctiphanes norvegica]
MVVTTYCRERRRVIRYNGVGGAGAASCKISSSYLPKSIFRSFRRHTTSILTVRRIPIKSQLKGGSNPKMAYSFDNRVNYIVRYMYDIDNNGFLDKNDFECMAVKNTIIECRGDFPQAAFETNQTVMRNLWNEIADLADFNKDGEVSVDEFKEAVKKNCANKTYDEFPGAFKIFIERQFKTIDVNGDGSVGVDEYRMDVISRAAFDDVAEIDASFEKLCNDEDREAGGISLPRYTELYAQYLSNPDETCPAVYLFGPLKTLNSSFWSSESSLTPPTPFECLHFWHFSLAEALPNKLIPKLPTAAQCSLAAPMASQISMATKISIA